MSISLTRGTPVLARRTRPHRLISSDTPNQDHASVTEHHQPDAVQVVHVQSSSSDTDNVSQVAHSLDNTSAGDETFPPAVQEHGSPIPEMRVSPSSPIVTPKSDDENLVHGIVLAHPARQKLQTKDNCGTTNTITCTTECDSKQSRT